MARGLPAIGSTVGGFPEVLPYEDLVPAGNVQTLAQKIREVLSNPERMNIMAARNLKKANEYREEILCERRIMFYRVLMEKTELWLSAE
jgi:glycosyltransferase involved in cell wall biosynthesis